MAIYKSDIVDINLETCNIHRAFLNRTIGSGDSGADHFGIRVFRNGAPVDLTGVSVQGIFLPPQGSPIAITDGNSVSGNEAYVVLPQACYNYDGQFCLSIKLVGGGVTGTMRIVDGMVDNTHSTGTVAPTDTVPTYQEILSAYDAMVAATAAANGAIAKPYAQLTFPVKKGDYTIVDGALKRALVDIATSETYTAAHWTDAKLGPDLSALKSAIVNSHKNGLQTFQFYGNFQHYGLNSDGTFKESQQYRVSNNDPMTFTEDITVHVASGFQWGYIPFTNGTPGSWSGWKTSDSVISANTIFVVQIARKTEVTSEIADVSTFCNALTFATKTQNQVDSISRVVTSAVADINKDQKAIGLDWLYGFIGVDGNFSAGGTDRLASRFIPCPPGVSITYVSETNHANVCGIAFYNKSTAFISGEKNNATIGTPATTVSPAGTAYLRLSTKVEIKDQTYLTFTGNNTQVLSWLQRQINDLPIYVDGTNGNDSTGAGTTGSPYKTIGKALQMGGRNICVKPGTYQEKVSASFLEYLHIYADHTGWASGTPNVPKVIIDGNSTIDTPLDLSYIRDLLLDDIIVQYSAPGKKGCVITNCHHLEMQNCEFNHNGHDGCVINYTNGIIRDCKADYNGNDGFNMNYYGDTQFYNCSGHDNVDDGISHHQGTTGMINGGEWYNNGKGGVASPAHGSQVDIYNVYCHNNGYGVYANADSDTVARTFHMWNCVLTNNSHYGLTCKRNTCIMYNCKITGNTEGQTTAPSGGSIITP